jgi:hypothetical protein
MENGKAFGINLSKPNRGFISPLAWREIESEYPMTPTEIRTEHLQNTILERFSFNLNIGRVELILGPRGTAATPDLLYLPRVIVRMEKLVE